MSVMRHSLKKQQHLFRPKIYYDIVTFDGFL